MTTVTQKLTDIFAKVFASLGHDASFGRVQVSDRPDLAPFQCNGALSAAKAAKKNPRAVAEEILSAVKDNPIFEKLELAGPGFINITPKDSFYTDALAQKSLVPQVSKPRKVFIDYGGANAAKPLHVGHLRAAIIGESIKRLYRLMGDETVGDVHWGDWGTHIGMLISEIERRGIDYKTVNDVMMAELYPAASARCKASEADMAEASKITYQLQQGDPNYRKMWAYLMEVSRKDQEAIYASIGVSFEQWFGESRYQDRIPKMIERTKKAGVAEESKGALIIRVAEESDKMEIPPLILTKTDGGFLYSTTDMATIEERVDEFNADYIMYVVDARQGLHFEQVFRAARKSGILSDNVKVDFLGYGTVNGTDGKPYKTRAGGTPQLKDLIEQTVEQAKSRLQEAEVSDDGTLARQIGLAAIKFGDLSNDFHQGYVFDPIKFTQFEGRTGPYLQYTAVRIASLLEKAKEQGSVPGNLTEFKTPEEKSLALQLCLMPDQLRVAYDKRAPHIVCDYAYTLAQSFSRFYGVCHILTATDKAQQASWLKLCALTLSHLKTCLDVIGIDIPKKM